MLLSERFLQTNESAEEEEEEGGTHKIKYNNNKTRN
jgi:hypothetical protein